MKRLAGRAILPIEHKVYTDLAASYERLATDAELFEGRPGRILNRDPLHEA